MFTVRRASRYIGFQWERCYPYGFGLLIGIAMIEYGPTVFAYSVEHGIHLENSYAPVAGVFAIIAGFLASFYGSIQALADTRLKRMAKTATFARLVRYTKEATIAGFLLSVISLPLIIVGPTEVTTFLLRCMLGLWCGLSAYAFLAFVRVGRNLFFVFEHEPPQDDGAY
jgi:hypothetical protein